MENNSKTDDTTSNDSVKRVDVSPSSNRPLYKVQSFVATPMPFQIEETEEIESEDTNCSSVLKAHPSNHPKSQSMRVTLSHKLRPFIRFRSSSFPNVKAKVNTLQAAESTQQDDEYDLRFFIIRHAERVDKYFGANWHMSAFNAQNQYHPYHRNFPSYLPERSNRSFWALDPPITAAGLNQAKRLGRVLKSKNFQPRYVYSSPAMRCILTAVQILKGLELDTKIPIRIEPGLLELGLASFGMNIFLQPNDWYKYGVNVDLCYKPISTIIPPLEQENVYYLRSKNIIREIEKMHDDPSSQATNILIVAHASSPDTLTWDLVGKQPNVQDLYKLALRVDYLQMAIAERKKENQSWSAEPAKWV